MRWGDDVYEGRFCVYDWSYIGMENGMSWDEIEEMEGFVLYWGTMLNYCVSLSFPAS